MKTLACIGAALLLLAPGYAQSKSELKKELRSMESAAKDNPDGLMEAANWAKENDLDTDFKRILKNILKLDADHEAANLAFGNLKWEGKWMPADKVAELGEKAKEAEFKAQGMVKVDGVWVEKDEVADAKKGVFHHAGQRVTREEKAALLGGKVRHPITGELIDRADEDKAQTMFPISDGRWVTEEAADKYHSNRQRPWNMRTHYVTVLSTLPLKTLKDVKLKVDQAYDHIKPLLGYVEPMPNHRPVMIVAATADEYRQWGNDIGDEGSTYGAFLAAQPIHVRDIGEVTPAVCAWHESWGPYYVRHAAAMAYLAGVCDEIEAEVPLWFLRAIGGYAERFANNYEAGFFGEQHIGKGGVKDIKSFLSAFSINPDMESRDIEYNIYQAGLLLSFAAKGGDDKATEAMLKVTDAFKSGKGKSIDRALAGLEKVLASRESEVKTHLQKLVQEKNKTK